MSIPTNPIQNNNEAREILKPEPSSLKKSGLFDTPIFSIVPSILEFKSSNSDVLKLNKKIKKETTQKEKKIYIPPQFRKYQTNTNNFGNLLEDNLLIHSLTDSRSALTQTWRNTANIGNIDFTMNELNQKMDQVNMKTDP